MDDREAEVRRIFDGALDLPPAERGGFLDRECAGKAELRRRLDAMLVAAAEPGFLGEATRSSTVGLASTPLRETAGSRIGPRLRGEPEAAHLQGVTPMAKTTKRTKRRNARRILDRITGQDPKLRKAVEEQKLNVRAAEMILAARERADLTQAQLAKLIGTTQSVISRLEDADYEGRSLTMLQRIADALNHRLEVRLVPLRA